MAAAEADWLGNHHCLLPFLLVLFLYWQLRHCAAFQYTAVHLNELSSHNVWSLLDATDCDPDMLEWKEEGYMTHPSKEALPSGLLPVATTVVLQQVSYRREEREIYSVPSQSEWEGIACFPQDISLFKLVLQAKWVLTLRIFMWNICILNRFEGQHRNSQCDSSHPRSEQFIWGKENGLFGKRKGHIWQTKI